MIGERGVCPLCGSPAAPALPLAQTTVRACESKDCGLRFADPQPTEEELGLAYTNLYYPGKEKEQAVRFENTPVETLRQVFEGLESRRGNLRGLRLLDFGCGRGPLLRVALEFGMFPSGIESDSEARSEAAKIPGAAIYASVEELRRSEPHARFDVIVLWTVIEHLRMPWMDLARLRTLLSPGGWLFLSTMDIRCLRARLERARWENYENPTHLYYFDRQSLARTIRQAGFTDFFEWRLKIRHPHHGLLRRLAYSLSFSLRLADGLFYLCKATEQDSDFHMTPALPMEVDEATPNRQLQERSSFHVGEGS